MFSHAYNMSVTGQNRPRGQAVLFLDTFTGQQGTSIADHTPDVGDGWEVLQYTGSGTILMNNDGMYLSQLDEFTSAIAKPRITERTNYAVEFDFKITYEMSSDDSWDLYFYLQDGPSVFQGIGFEFFQQNTTLTLYYWSNDGATNSQIELTLTPLEVHTFRIEADSQSWRFLIDGVEIDSSPLSMLLYDPFVQFDFGNYTVTQAPVVVDRVTVFQTPAVSPLTPFSGYLPSMTGTVTFQDDMTGGSTLLNRTIAIGPQWLLYQPGTYTSPAIVNGAMTNTAGAATAAHFATPRGVAAELMFDMNLASTSDTHWYFFDIVFGPVSFSFRYYGDEQRQELVIMCPSGKMYTFNPAIPFDTTIPVHITYTTCETIITIGAATVVHSYHTYTGSTYNALVDPVYSNVLFFAAPPEVLSISSFQIKEYVEVTSASITISTLEYTGSQSAGALVGVVQTVGIPVDFRFTGSNDHTSADGSIIVDSYGNITLTDVGEISAINGGPSIEMYTMQCRGIDGNWSAPAQISINVTPA